MKIIPVSCLMLLGAFFPSFVHAQPKITYAVLTGTENIIWERDMRLGENTIPLSDSGTFYYKLKLNTPELFTLVHENKKVGLYIRPGNSLHLNLNKAQVTISGNNARLNMTLQDYLKVVQRSIDFLDKNNATVFSLPLTVFNQKIDSLKQAEIKSHTEFMQKPTGDTKFLKNRLAA